MPKEQRISVNFCDYLPYDSIPYTCISLGTITTKQLDMLLAEFAKNSSRPHTCIQTMSIDFSDRLSFGQLPGNGRRYRTLDLSNMFYFYDTTNPKPIAPCMHHLKKQPQSTDAMIKACAHNLKCGLCRDEFIRRTLGVTLYSQKYATEKQK